MRVHESVQIRMRESYREIRDNLRRPVEGNVMLTSNLQVQLRPIDLLVPRAENPRTHTPAQVARIAASIEEFGWTNPILVGADNDIIAGHGRLLAARELKMADVPVIILGHLSDTQRRALVITDNQLALNAGWDEEMLRVQLAALQEDAFDLQLIGFDDEELAAILADEGHGEGLTDENSVPEIDNVAVSLPGDAWMLAEHKLYVGDATKQADVGRLMGGDIADMAFTDLPYNVNYEGFTEDRLRIRGDKMTAAEFRGFLAESFRGYRQIVKAGASVYVCHPSLWQREFQNAIEVAGFEVRCQIIWAKNTFAWGFGRYKFQHEPIFYCHVAG